MASNQADVAYSDTNGFKTATIYYVATNGLDTGANDGLSWAQPFKTISNAVAYTVNRDAVVVSNGTYNLTVQLTVTNAITLMSANGAAVTIIDGGNGRRCLLVSNSVAVIKGLTLQRGNISAGGGNVEGGGGVWVQYGTVSNCLIANNTAGYGAGVKVHNSSLVTHCIIANNTGANGAGAQLQFAGTGRLRNCLIYGNSGGPASGALLLAGGSLENCTVVSNTCAGNDANFPGAVGATTGRVIINTIIRNNNYTVMTPTNFGTNFTPTVTYSCLEFAWPGEGNLYTNALFVNPTATNGALLGTSPCINAGTNLSWMTANAVDLTGKLRIAMRVVDMGAYEFPMPPGTVYSLR